MRPLRPEKETEVEVNGPYQVLQELLVLKHTWYEVAFVDVCHVKTAALREIPDVPLEGLTLLKAPGKTLAGATVRVKERVCELRPSLTSMLNAYVAAVLGVPEIVPLETVRPLLAHAESPVIVQVYVPVPPEAWRFAE